ncbi:hypothetical protein HDK90DRAFT_73760 [Phyllosticta capitalensis]|uniref:Secreted protein n=1 Tax=Phyllosticta capitalensis TaxID=121624 RepID=A0ABR1YCY4_9PEZI
MAVFVAVTVFIGLYWRLDSSTRAAGDAVWVVRVQVRRATSPGGCHGAQDESGCFERNRTVVRRYILIYSTGLNKLRWAGQRRCGSFRQVGELVDVSKGRCEVLPGSKSRGTHNYDCSLWLCTKER